MSVNYLGSLIGTEVKINRGGPDSIVGRLLSVHYDYLAIQIKDGTIVYIQSQHIKSISSTNSNVSRGNKSNRSNRASQRFETAYTFEGLLGQLRYTNVQINRGGPEKVEGLVVHSGDNILLLVVNNEIIRIPIFHVKSINAANKNNSKSNKSDSKDNKDNKDNKSNKATAAQIVAIKLMLKKYRSR
jgi:spore coat protein B